VSVKVFHYLFCVCYICSISNTSYDGVSILSNVNVFVDNLSEVKEVISKLFPSHVLRFGDILVCRSFYSSDVTLVDLKSLSESDRELYSVSRMIRCHYENIYSSYDGEEPDYIVGQFNELFETGLFTQELLDEAKSVNEKLHLSTTSNYSVKNYVSGFVNSVAYLSESHSELIQKTLRTYLEYYDLSQADVEGITEVLKKMTSAVANLAVDYSVEMDNLKAELKSIHANRRDILSVVSKAYIDVRFKSESAEIDSLVSNLGGHKSEREELLKEFFGNLNK